MKRGKDIFVGIRFKRAPYYHVEMGCAFTPYSYPVEKICKSATNGGQMNKPIPVGATIPSTAMAQNQNSHKKTSALRENHIEKHKIYDAVNEQRQSQNPALHSAFVQT